MYSYVNITYILVSLMNRKNVAVKTVHPVVHLTLLGTRSIYCQKL